MAEFSPDPCGPPYGKEEGWHTVDVEQSLFSQAADIVTEALNAAPAGPGSARERAAEALKKLEHMSAGINSSWPDESRFHFEILELPPLLVLKLSFRTNSRWFVFAGQKETDGKPNETWREVESDLESIEHESPRSLLALYALQRSPSRKPRFLARFVYFGCAGSSGLVYDAREWNPEEGGLSQVIKQEGALGMDDSVPGFPQVGKLQTHGALITLPYCWFSAVDTWDNPSLCAVDTYDLSGDDVKFRSRTYNRPDLVPIAKAIEYAEKRDYPAVLGYCGSPDVARRLVRDLPPFVFAEDLRVARTGSGKERVEMGYDPTYRFDVEKRADRWLVVGFSSER